MRALLRLGRGRHASAAAQGAARRPVRHAAASTTRAGMDPTGAANADAGDGAAAAAFRDAAALRTWLEQRGVRTGGWGPSAGAQSSSKSVEDLFDEVAAGESALLDFEGGATATAPPTATATATALRSVEVVSLTLSAPDRPSMVLVEASQQLPDGRVRKRGLLPLSEKMRAGERWHEAARRGVREELGSAAAAAPSDGDLVSLDEASHVVEVGPVRDALSYPGLPARYTVHRAKGVLSASAFAAVLPGALLRRQRRQEQQQQQSQQHAPDGPLEFETVEEMPGKGAHRTTWRWVEEEEEEEAGGQEQRSRRRGAGGAEGGGGGGGV